MMVTIISKRGPLDRIGAHNAVPVYHLAPSVSEVTPLLYTSSQRHVDRYVKNAVVHNDCSNSAISFITE